MVASLRLTDGQSATAPAAMTTGDTRQSPNEFLVEHDLSRKPVPTFRDHALVIVSRHRFLRDPLIFHGWLQDHAVAELIDHAALDFLPWRLSWRVMVAAIFLQGRAARRQFIR